MTGKKSSKLLLPIYHNIFPYIFAIVLIVSIAILNYCFPKSCDDLTFSGIPTSSLTKLFGTALNQGNGRLLGNFFGYLISNRYFTLAEKTFIWFGIIFLMIKLVGSKNHIINTIIAAVMVYPCDSIFSQVYAWNSGFQNYAFPVFIILFDILFIKINIQKDTKIRILSLFALVLTAFAGQFFSENSSFFAVCLSATVLLYCLKYKKSTLFYPVAYFFSTATGFIIMMIYPHILGTSQKIASYRKYANSINSLISLATGNYRLISREFARFFILWIIVSIAYILLINKILNKIYSKRKCKIALFISEAVLFAYPVLSFSYDVMIKSSITFPRYYFNYLLCGSLALYIIVLIFINILLLKSYQDKVPSGLFFLSIFSAMPLLVVSPIGSRTFYIPFVFLFMSSMCILRKYVSEGHLNKILTGSICMLSICCMLSVLIMAEFDNKYCSSIRESYLVNELKNGNDDITLPLLPHQNIIHDDNNNGAWSFYIKNKYGKEINCRFTEWNQWYEEYYRH